MVRFSRQPTADGHTRASTLELFYDLVFVFAITQVSHFLLADEGGSNLSWEGAGQAAVILVAVWWSWNYTTWTTNELDTEAPAVRGMVIAVMLGSLLMAIAIPEAWGERALLFAGAYVAIQVGRHAFLAFVAGSRNSIVRTRASRILIWFIASGVFWIAGALTDGGVARTGLWLIALAIDLAGPFVTYHLPGLERMRPEVWSVTSEHFSERFQLFVIIALGESIVITGTTASGLELTNQAAAAFVVAFLGSAAFWWLYFNRAAERLAGHLERAENRTLVARDIYTYLHILVIAGIIVAAVGDELLIAHPDHVLATNELVFLVAGPVIYLAALSAIRFRAAGSISPKRTAAAIAIALIGLIFQNASALLIATLILVVLVVLIVAEERRRTPDLTAKVGPE
jgi:low temperature requirement protein LtrA